MQDSQELQLNLTIDEVKSVVDILANLPYKQVFSLIPKIQQQAGEQPEATEFQLKLTIEEANLAMQALGSQPYERVCNLVAKIQQQAQQQLQPSDSADSQANSTQTVTDLEPAKQSAKPTKSQASKG